MEMVTVAELLGPGSFGGYGGRGSFQTQLKRGMEREGASRLTLCLCHTMSPAESHQGHVEKPPGQCHLLVHSGTFGGCTVGCSYGQGGVLIVLGCCVTAWLGVGPHSCYRSYDSLLTDCIL